MVKEIRTRESVDVEDDVEVKIHVLGYSFGSVGEQAQLGCCTKSYFLRRMLTFVKANQRSEVCGRDAASTG